MEYRTSTPRTLGLAGLAVLMIAASYFSTQIGSRFMGWSGVAFFGLCLVGILSQLLRHGPTVVIDDLGVFDRRLRIGRIPWEDIASVSVAQVRRQRLISLWLRNEEQYLPQGSAVIRRLAASSRAMGVSPFSMSFMGLTPGLDEAYARLRARLPERAGL
jgi:hypothetical protein